MSSTPTITSAPKTDPKIAALLRKGWRNLNTVKPYKWDPKTAIVSFKQVVQLAQAAKDRESVADGLNSLAYMGRSTNRDVLAKQYYGRAIAIYQGMGNIPKQARALFFLAEVYRYYHRKANYKLALDYYGKALKLYRRLNQERDVADTLYGMGAIYQNTGQTALAAQHYQEALRLYQKLRALRAQGASLCGLAWAAQTRGQFTTAAQQYEKALRFYRQIHSNRGVGLILFYMGNLYDQLNDWNKSISYYKRSAKECLLTGDGERPPQPDPWTEMYATINIGAAYAHLGDLKQSLQYYSKALPTASDISPYNHGRICMEIGRIYNSLGSQGQALAHYREARNLFVHVEKAWDGTPYADTLLTTGNVRLDVGDFFRKRGNRKESRAEYQGALSYYSRSVQVAHDDLDAPQEVDGLRKMSAAYVRLGDLGRANATYQRALTLAKQTQQPWAEATAYYDIGTLQSSRGQYQSALASYQRALVLQQTQQNRAGAADTLLALGDTHFKSGHFGQSATFYRRAIGVYRAIGDQSGETDALFALARVEVKQGDLAGAERDLQAAIALIEKMRKSLGDLSQLQVGFLTSRLSIYSLCIDVLLREGKNAAAFAVVEKTKARALIDLMNGGHVALTKYLPETELAKLNRLRNAAAQANQALISAQSSGTTAQQVAQKSRALSLAQSELESYSDTLYATHPELARLQITSTLDLAGVGRFLPADTALLDYVTLRAEGIDKTLLFCITREGDETRLKVYPINQTRAYLAAHTDAFWEACRNPEKDYEPEAHTLSNLLVAPAAAQIQGKRQLLIAPDGPLWDVQFAALLAPSSQGQGGQTLSKGKAPFIGEKYALTYAQSATAAYAAKEERQAATRSQAPDQMLVMANPDFGGAARLGASQGDTLASLNFLRGLISPGDRSGLLLDSTGAIRPLPGTQTEADDIERSFPNAMMRTGVSASEDYFKAAAGRCRVIHLATHAVVNQAAPLYSIILLAQPSQGSQEDGYLTARELFDMRLPADLVVLSACETGRGQNHSGEGIIGLSWALFAAGAPSQIVSQWKVNDASTATLMGDFYAHLKSGQIKSVALQQATVKLMHDGKHAHPFYWAPFTLLGDGN